MSYLSMLQQQIAQRDQDARRFGDIISTGFGAYYQEQERQRQEQERQRQEQKQRQEQERQMAMQEAQMFQKMGASALEYGQPQEAARLLSQYQSRLQAAFPGINIPKQAVVGAPVMGTPPPLPASAAGSPFPMTAEFRNLAPRKPVEVSRDFTQPQTISALRAGLMMPRQEPMIVGKSIYDPAKGTYTLLPEAQQQLDIQRQELELRRQQIAAENQMSRERLAIQRAEARRGGGAGGGRPPRLVQVTMPDGSTVLMPAQKGLAVAPPPRPKPERQPKISKEEINYAAFTRFADDLSKDTQIDDATKNTLSNRALSYIEGRSRIMPNEFKKYIADEVRKAARGTQAPSTPGGTGALGTLMEMMEKERVRKK